MEQREEHRKLPLEGADNFRDLGGYETADGRLVKWGMIYRSGHLHDLTKGDLVYLSRLGLRRIADFRGPTEKDDEPDKVPEGAVGRDYPIDIAGDDLREQVIAVIRGESDMDVSDYLVTANREFATTYTPVYRDWLTSLAREEGALPQVFHCTAGKDRAGFATAVLLRILGVPESTVVEDYLKSNLYLAEYIEKTLGKIRLLSLFRNDGEEIRPLLGVDDAYIRAAFDAIDDQWGSFDAYVAKGLGFTEADIETLKERLLEPSNP